MNNGVANGTADDDGGAYDEFLQYVNSPEKEEAAPAPTVKLVASAAVAIDGDVETGTKTTTTSHSYSRESTRNANGSTAHGSNHSRRFSTGRRRSSTTEERRNPFALREGNALIWRNVNMTLVSCCARCKHSVHRKGLMCM